MTVKEADRVMCFCEAIPVQICGITAKMLGGSGYEYTRISAVSKRKTSKGGIFFEAELVEERAGRCHSVIHVDVKDVKIADSVSEDIKRSLLENPDGS